MLQFVFNNELTYYSRLKHMYSDEEWSEVFTYIITTFNEERYLSSAYVEILKEEKRGDLLVEYCSKNLYSIKDLYPYLINDYFNEVNALVVNLIEYEAKEPGDKRKYKKVCSLIKLYRKICGSTSAQLVIDYLKEEYKRRPTFIDELSKIK